MFLGTSATWHKTERISVQRKNGLQKLAMLDERKKKNKVTFKVSVNDVSLFCFLPNI